MPVCTDAATRFTQEDMDPTGSHGEPIRLEHATGRALSSRRNLTRKRRVAPKFSCTPSGGLAKPGLGALMSTFQEVAEVDLPDWTRFDRSGEDAVMDRSSWPSELALLAPQVVGCDLMIPTPYGRRRVVYADWTASGRLLRPLEQRLLEVVGPWMANTHTETSSTGQAMTLAYSQARRIIKHHVNAGDSDVLLATGTGCTGAINKLQRLLGLRVPSNFIGQVDVPVDDRALVLVTHMEHHSNQTSWLECFADVEVIPATDDGLVDVAAIPAILTRYANRSTKIAAITACSNVTGIHTPYHDIAAIMHAHGGLCFVDFACSAPYVAIDMHPANPERALDAIYFSPHKFLGGPGSCGILVFARRLYAVRVPDEPGGGTVAWTNPWRGHRYYEGIEVREDGGTPGILQLIRAALAVQVKETIGQGVIDERERRIVQMVFDRLGNLPRVVLLAAQHRDRLPVFSFYIEGLHYNLVVRLLNDRFGIQARGGCSCAGTYGHYLLNVDPQQSNRITSLIDGGDVSEKPGWVRVSLHPIMSDQEIAFVCSAIADISRLGDTWSLDYERLPMVNDYRHVSSSDEIQTIVSRWFGRFDGTVELTEAGQ